jgi:oligoendopeptidase F
MTITIIYDKIPYMLKKRNQISSKHKWDLSAIYKNDQAWERDFSYLKKNFSSLLKYKGKLDSSKYLYNFLIKNNTLGMIEENLLVYAYMRFYEDAGNKHYETLKGRVDMLMSEMATALTFVSKELSSISSAKLKKLLKADKRLAEFKYFLENYSRYQPHILSNETEGALASLSPIIGKFDDIFSALTDTNFKHEPFVYKGKKYELTHGLYRKYQESGDRGLRQMAFTHYYKPFVQFADTIANTYAGNVSANTTLSRLKKYKSAEDRSLFHDDLKPVILDNLISAAKAGGKVLTRLNNLRKKELKLKDLHFYDVYAPLVALDKTVTYEQSIKITREAVSILGPKYLKKYETALKNKVVDVYESVGKRSGAFSWGSYSSCGYVFLNHTDKPHDLFTFAHEFGHSIHRDFSIENQPFHYYNNLLFDYLIKNSKSAAEKKFYIFQYISMIQATFFRQTMFASFERETHRLTEKGEILTASRLNSLYREHLDAFLGGGMTIDSELEFEWARIPHFYTPFYVYKYATSVSAAIALSEMVLSGKKGAVEKYLKFLSSGSHKEPMKILQDAGVDLSKKSAFEHTVKKMGELIESYNRI